MVPQTKPSFVTYPLSGLTTLNPNGAIITFADGHQRQLPVITAGPFEYTTYAVEFYQRAKAFVPSGSLFKQAVIAPSAMTLLYPSDPIPDYSREDFIADVIRCGVQDIRKLFDAGVDIVQVDFTEGRLALKLDPSGGLLKSFLDVNEKVFQSFTEEERQRIGVHSCPGADQDCTHSADIDYSALLPSLFQLSVGRFYLEMKSEAEPERIFQLIQANLRPNQTIFIGVTDVNNTRIETAEEVASFIESALKYISVQQLGTTDDCGFSPFADDISTSRDIAFAKIKARIEGTQLVQNRL
jgi:5-methyltetrahydropteroyltriglutamate--homocysteine methyltransferase